MHRILRLLSLALLSTCLAAACAQSEAPMEEPGTNNEGSGQESRCVDADSDGAVGRAADCTWGDDCDDTDPQTYPGATEACGDRKDNNCDGVVDEGCAVECVDADNDNYGQGPACLGVDCDDDDPTIHPGATEICGNDVDENCDGTAAACATNCIDADQDGYGAAGSTDCATMGVDCDDSNASVHPGADEVCDGDDNDCDGTRDECALEGQTCTGGSCQGGTGAQCENHDDCDGLFLRCDASSNPKVCKQAGGGLCNSSADCLQGLSCEGGSCTGNWCDANTCSGDYSRCDRDAAACVQCPHWDPVFAVRDAACTDGGVQGAPEQCTRGGWCAEKYELDSDAPYPNSQTTADVFKMSLALANCWIHVKPRGVKDMCYAFWLHSSVSRALSEWMVEGAYRNGAMDAVLYADENEALSQIWGDPNFFLPKMIEWKVDLQPGSSREVCLWYQPAESFFSAEKLVLDDCVNFAP